MAEVMRGDAALAVPFDLEGKRADDVIDPFSHFLDAPAGPAPQLRRHEVENRNAMKVRPPRDPPVEARKVDEHDRIRTMMGEVAIGTREEREKDVDVGEHASKPHHRQLAERVKQLAAGLGHALAAEADALDARTLPEQFTHQVAAVDVAARFARTDEYSHGHLRVHVSRYPRCQREGLRVCLQRANNAIEMRRASALLLVLLDPRSAWECSAPALRG